jgi:hypothetical protein
VEEEAITDINEINTGDNLLVSSKSWLARQIQKFQKIEYPEGGKWNHSAMFWWCYNELFVIEADKYGIACTPFKEYINSNRELLVLKPKFKVNGSEYGKFMLPFCGHTKYGKLNLIFAQSIKILTLGSVWLGPSKKNTDKFICGEFVSFTYNHFNPEIFPDWNRMAPADIYVSSQFEHYLFLK